MLRRIKTWAALAQRNIYALYLAGRDPRVPRPASRVAAVAVVVAWLVAGGLAVAALS